MIKEGLLDKYGKPNENTPENWRQTFYKDVYVLNINYIQGLQVNLYNFIKIFLLIRVENIKTENEGEESLKVIVLYSILLMVLIDLEWNYSLLVYIFVTPLLKW